MSTALRAISLVLLCAVFLLTFFVIAFAAEDQDDGDGNLQCPSVPSLYVYVSGVKYGEKVGDKVNLYGKKCVDLENKEIAAQGHCVGPKKCNADLCDGKPCALPKLKIEDVRKAVYEGAPPTPPTTVPPGTPGSLLDQWMLNPAPASEQKAPLSPSADSVGEVLKQADGAPGFVDKARESIGNFFFPRRSVNDAVELKGGTIPGVDSNPVQTTQENGGAPGTNTFQPYGAASDDQANTFQQEAKDCGWLCWTKDRATNLWEGTKNMGAKVGDGLDYVVDNILTSPADGRKGSSISVSCADDPSLCPSSKTGIVSWYNCGTGGDSGPCIGTKDNPINPNDYTVASAYPDNTVLKVCAGERCVAVVSNDKGGFIDNPKYSEGQRVGDLTRPAFLKIADPELGLKQGLIKNVTLTPVGMYSDYATAKAAAENINTPAPYTPPAVYDLYGESGADYTVAEEGFKNYRNEQADIAVGAINWDSFVTSDAQPYDPTADPALANLDWVGSDAQPEGAESENLTPQAIAVREGLMMDERMRQADEEARRAGLDPDAPPLTPEAPRTVADIEAELAKNTPTDVPAKSDATIPSENLNLLAGAQSKKIESLEKDLNLLKDSYEQNRAAGWNMSGAGSNIKRKTAELEQERVTYAAMQDSLNNGAALPKDLSQTIDRMEKGQGSYSAGIENFAKETFKAPADARWEEMKKSYAEGDILGAAKSWTQYAGNGIGGWLVDTGKTVAEVSADKIEKTADAVGVPIDNPFRASPERQAFCATNSGACNAEGIMGAADLYGIGVLGKVALAPARFIGSKADDLARSASEGIAAPARLADDVVGPSLPKAANIDSAGDAIAPATRNIDDALARFEGAANDVKSLGSAEPSAPHAPVGSSASDNPFLQGTDRITGGAAREAEAPRPSAQGVRDASAEIDKIAADARAAAEAPVLEVIPAVEVPIKSGIQNMWDYVPGKDNIRLAWNNTVTGVKNTASDVREFFFGGKTAEAPVIPEKPHLESVAENQNLPRSTVESPAPIAEEARIAAGGELSVPFPEPPPVRTSDLRIVREEPPVVPPESAVPAPDNLAALRKAAAEDLALKERIAADAARQAENTAPPNWAQSPNGLPKSSSPGSVADEWAKVDAALAKPKVAEVPTPVTERPALPDATTRNPLEVMGDEGPVPTRAPAQGDLAVTRTEPSQVVSPELATARAEQSFWERWFGKSEPAKPVETVKAPTQSELDALAAGDQGPVLEPRVKNGLPDTTTRNPIDVIGDEGLVVERTVRTPSAVPDTAGTAIAAEKPWYQRWYEGVVGKKEPVTPTERPGLPDTVTRDPIAVIDDEARAVVPREKTNLPDSVSRDPLAVMGDEGIVVEATPRSVPGSAKAWNDPALTRNEFISDYKTRYPNTTLSDAQLAERFNAGQRLNPETGRFKVPDTPAATTPGTNVPTAAGATPASESLLKPWSEWSKTAKWTTGLGVGTGGLLATKWGLDTYLGGTPPPKTPAGEKPPVVGAGVPDKEVKDKVPPPAKIQQPCGPNDTYASSGCYPSYTPPGLSQFVSAVQNPNGPILDRDYYCITNLNPVMVVPLAAGSRFPSNCHNSYDGNTNSNPFSALGQMLGKVFGTSSAAPTQQPKPTTPVTPPIVPPTSTSTGAKPFATLIADPIKILSGKKSKLIWSSVNTSGCELFAPGGFLMATGIRGSTSTLALATTTRFTLNCSAPSGATTSAQATVTVQ